jgi:hypothetical protein
MNSPVSRAPGFEWRSKARAEGLGMTFDDLPESRMAGAKTVLWND